MKFQNPSLNFFLTDGRTHTHTHTHKPKPICSPLFQSWGHNKGSVLALGKDKVKKQKKTTTEIRKKYLNCLCICMVYEVEANTGINTSGESALNYLVAILES